MGKLSDDLSVATRSAYDMNLDKALRRRNYERQAGATDYDQTELEKSIIAKTKQHMGPMWSGTVTVELDDMGTATCKVYRGEQPDEEALQAVWTHNRTSVV